MSSKARRFVTVRNGAIVAAAASAAVASAWERTHRHVTGAVLTESDLRVERLSDLQHETAMLEAIQSGLEQEWGSFAFLGFADVREMAAEAGQTIFVVVERDEKGAHARGIVQTTLAGVHGDAELLAEAYPSFQSLTSRESWKRSRNHGGDTAVLLQITTLGPERGGGLGSLLRNAVLNMLPKQVQFALTTTPVDGTRLESIDTEDASTYTPAMRFHARGGANPARMLPEYKMPAGGAVETAHGRDVVVMRYERDETGAWPAKRPPMRVRSVGPLQERALRTGRSLRVRALKAPRPHLTLPSLHRPSIHAPSMPSFPRPHVTVPKVRVMSGIKQRAARLRRREAKPDEEVLPSEPETEVPGAEAAKA
jgi:hypothetical protein